MQGLLPPLQTLPPQSSSGSSMPPPPSASMTPQMASPMASQMSSMRNTIKIIAITSVVINAIIVLVLIGAIVVRVGDTCGCNKLPVLFVIGILLLGSLFHIGVGSFVINRTK